MRPSLFDAGFQANTSSVIAASKSSFEYSTAAMVWSDIRVTFSSVSCSAPPYDHMRARAYMFESISCDIPKPIWMFCSLKILPPPSRSSSHVEGSTGKPASTHRDLRQSPGSGDHYDAYA